MLENYYHSYESKNNEPMSTLNHRKHDVQMPPPTTSYAIMIQFI